MDFVQQKFGPYSKLKLPESYQDELTAENLCWEQLVVPNPFAAASPSSLAPSVGMIVLMVTALALPVVNLGESVPLVADLHEVCSRTYCQGGANFQLESGQVCGALLLVQSVVEFAKGSISQVCQQHWDSLGQSAIARPVQQDQMLRLMALTGHLVCQTVTGRTHTGWA